MLESLAGLSSLPQGLGRKSRRNFSGVVVRGMEATPTDSDSSNSRLFLAQFHRISLFGLFGQTPERSVAMTRSYRRISIMRPKTLKSNLLAMIFMISTSDTFCQHRPCSLKTTTLRHPAKLLFFMQSCILRGGSDSHSHASAESVVPHPHIPEKVTRSQAREDLCDSYESIITFEGPTCMDVTETVAVSHIPPSFSQ